MASDSATPGEHKSSRRYAGDVGASVRAVLKDTGAAMVGTPQWKREDDTELYDAILLIRDMIVRANHENYPEELPFNIGSSYQRWIVSWLSSTFDHRLFTECYANGDANLIAALDVLDRRVAREIS
jgi:hypothetical protein